MPFTKQKLLVVLQKHECTWKKKIRLQYYMYNIYEHVHVQYFFAFFEI
jgi:hypothetical protein